MFNSVFVVDNVNRLGCQEVKKIPVQASRDLAAPAFRFENYWRNRRELEVVEREVQQLFYHQSIRKGKSRVSARYV